MATTEIEQAPPIQAEPTRKHQWLQRLVGEWTYEAQAIMAPGQPVEKFSGRESVRSVGDLWIVATGQGEIPGGIPATTVLTLGYDPRTKRYVGTWVGSMMTHLWVYDGEMDADEKTLTLNSDGPDMITEGKMAKYRDVVELIGDDRRVLTSYRLGEGGQWAEIMYAEYRRVK